MKVMFLNNDGAGFADYVEIQEGTTLLQFLELKMPGSDPKGYVIRVNRQPAPSDQILVDDDRVSVTPSKIEGA